MNKKHLAILFILTLLLRLILAFSQPNLTYDSYFHLRQVEHITNTGLPLYDDPLSYGGRTNLFLPLFHYLAAAFSLIFPIELVAKILPNLLLATLPLIIYLLANKTTKNHKASLLAALAASLLPALYHTNSFTPASLFLPLIFLTIYAFLKHTKVTPFLYIFSFIAVSFTSPNTALLLIGFIIYLLLALLERKKVPRTEIELIIFSVFFYIWSQFLFFKNTLLEEGVQVIWQNVPPQIVQQYFPAFSLTNSLLLVSIIPFIAGTYIVYRSLFKLKFTKEFFIISLVISTTLLTWLKIIPFEESLSFFGLSLAALFASFYIDITKYTATTKLNNLQKYFFPVLAILLVVSMLPSTLTISLQQPLPTDEEITAFKWLEDNTPEGSKVLALLEEGHLVTYYGKRKNFMDTQYNAIHNIEEEFTKFNTLFTTTFSTAAVEILDGNNINYLMITPKGKEKYHIPTFRYIDAGCFSRVYKEETKIYERGCVLE